MSKIDELFNEFRCSLSQQRSIRIVKCLVNYSIHIYDSRGRIDPRFWTNLSYPYPACNFDLSNSGNRVTSAGICRFVTPSSILLKTTTSLSSLNPWAINYSEHDPISKANKFFYHLTRDRESNHNIRNLRSILLIRTEFKNLKRCSKSNRVKEQFCLQRPSISNKSSTNPNSTESRGGGGGRSPWIEILIARSIEFPLAHARTQLEEERRKPYIRDTVKSVVRVMSRDATKSGLETPFSIDQRN